MLCPKCQFTNTADARFCLVCGTSLLATVSSNNSVDPFEGFTPDWLSGSEASASYTANSGFATSFHEPISHEPISIEDLLRDSAVINNATASGKSSYPPASSSNTEPPPFDVSITGNKLSPHQPSPRHYGLVAGDESHYAPPTYVPLRSNPYVPADGSHISGVYKGCFYYPDGFGETIVVPLAGFWSRLKGAVIDYFITSILNLVFWFGTLFFLGRLKGLMNWVGVNVNPTPDSSQFNTIEVLLTIGWVIVAVNMIPFLYHVLMVGMTGQTFGHRWSDIMVMKKGNKTIGAFSAIVRALWGIVYSYFITAISLFAAIFSAAFVFNLSKSGSMDDQVNAFGFEFLFFVYFYDFLALLLVIVLMLMSKGKQAMNDKLAGTYVVKTTELTRF